MDITFPATFSGLEPGLSSKLGYVIKLHVAEIVCLE